MPNALCQLDHLLRRQLFSSHVSVELQAGQHLVDLALVQTIFDRVMQRRAEELATVNKDAADQTVKVLQVCDAARAGFFAGG